MDKYTADVVSGAEFARRAGVSKQYINRLVSQNKLSSIEIGRQRFIPLFQLEAFLQRKGSLKVVEGGSNV